MSADSRVCSTSLPWLGSTEKTPGCRSAVLIRQNWRTVVKCGKGALLGSHSKDFGVSSVITCARDNTYADDNSK